MTHQIELKDLQDWIEQGQEMTFSSSLGKGEDKKLNATSNGSFKVYKDGVVYWEGIQPFRAVEKYNEI